MTQRRVWKTNKAGAINNLALQTEKLPLLNPEEVQIQVKAVGLNFADIFALTGLYSATPNGSFIPGLEFSGVVESVGNNCTAFKVGDRIMGVTRFGGYVDTIQSQPEYLVALPDDWSFSQGAAYLTQTLTAWYALTDLGNLKAKQAVKKGPKKKVLVQSAAGGVGLQAMKLIAALDGEAYGTVRSTAKKEFLNDLGFNNIWVREKSFTQQLKRNGQQFDLVLDAIGGEVQKASFNALNPMGRLVVFGAAEFTPGKNRPNYLKAIWQYLKRPKYDVMDMISDNRSVLAFNLIWLWEHIDVMQDLLEDMMKVDIAPPYVGHEYPFEEALSAIECLRSGDTIGKVVLKVSPKI